MKPDRPRYAVWRAGAKAPRTPWPLRAGLVGWMTSSFGLTWAIMHLREVGVDGVLWLAFFNVASQTVFCFGVVLQQRERKLLVPQTDEPIDCEQFPVLATFKRELNYATDGGRISFVDGWLVFRGTNQEFAVRKEDVRLPSDYDSPLEFSFTGPGGEHRVRIRPFDKKFRNAWKEWRFDRSAPTGTSLFPPVTPLSSNLRDYFLFAALLTVTGCLFISKLPSLTLYSLSIAGALFYSGWWYRRAYRRIAVGGPSLRPYQTIQALRMRNLPNDKSPAVLEDSRALSESSL